MKKDGFLITVIVALAIAFISTFTLAITWMARTAMVSAGSLLEVGALWQFAIVAAVIDFLCAAVTITFLIKRRRS